MNLTFPDRPNLPPLRHSWYQCITVGRGYDLLRADLQEHLRFLQKEIGYKHIRFHASFHDDVGVVHKRPDGSKVYRWTQLDHIYDFLVDAGFAPIVEINSMPQALASGDQRMFWYKKNVTPPADYSEWEDFMRAFIKHFAERYGLHRLRTWDFEIWNEPNLRGQFWTGTKEEYFKLYASCAKVLKAFDPELQVGGPSGAGAEWNLDFARFCRDTNTPVDFISYHMYPQNEGFETSSPAESKFPTGMYFVEKLRQAQKELQEEGFGDLPLLMTEWNTQAMGPDWKAKWVGNENVSNLFAGAAVCHLATACDDLVDCLGWWVASDVFEEAGPHFEPYGTGNQYYGMLTVDGLPKAAYHGFRFLHQMRGSRYEPSGLQEAEPTQSCIVTDEGSATRCLIWNCQFPHLEGKDWTCELALPVPETHRDAEEVRVVIALVSQGQGSAYEYWKAMGSPPVLTRMEQDCLAARSRPAYQAHTAPVEDAKVMLNLTLRPNQFALIEIGGHPAVTAPTQLTQEQNQLDSQLDLESRI